MVSGLQTLVYPAVCGAVRPLSGACMALCAAEVAVAACFRWADGSGFKLEGWLVIRARASRVSLASEVRMRR